MQLSTRNHRRRRPGFMIAAELLFVLPILLMFLLGVVQFYMLVETRIDLLNASRAGCRVAVSGGHNHETQVNEEVAKTVHRALGDGRLSRFAKVHVTWSQDVDDTSAGHHSHDDGPDGAPGEGHDPHDDASDWTMSHNHDGAPLDNGRDDGGDDEDGSQHQHHRHHAREPEWVQVEVDVRAGCVIPEVLGWLGFTLGNKRIVAATCMKQE